MITFEQIRLVDFGPFRDSTIPLENQGLVLIRGDNRDTTASNSNGAGKTTIFKGLTWCLFGKTLYGERPDDVKRVGAKGACVQVYWKTDSERYRAIRRSNPSKLDLQQWVRGGSMTHKVPLGWDIIAGATIKETEEKIQQLLGADFATFTNTVLYGQDVFKRFASGATTDAERKAILKQVLNLEQFDLALAAAKTRQKEWAEECGELEDKERSLEHEVEKLATSDGIWAASVKSFATELDSLKGRLKKRPRLQKVLKKLGELLSELAATHIERDGLAEAMTKNAELRTNLGADLRVIDKERADLGAALKLLSGSKCPTCGTSTKLKTIATRKAELDERLKAVCEKQTALADEQGAKTVAGKAMEAKRDELDEQLEDEDDFKEKAAELEAELKVLAEVDSRSQTLKLKIGETTHQQKLTVREVAELRNSIDRTKLARSEIMTSMIHADFWIEGFGNEGVPSFVMDLIIPELTERANRYLSTLSDGTMRVQFDTETKLKSGKVRDRFEISVEVEGQTNVTMSGGQQRKVALSTDLALMDLVASRESAAIDLLLLDEVLDGLDEVGKARVADLLQDLRKTRSSILVISHDAEVKEIFERSIIVVKEDGEARVEMV